MTMSTKTQKQRSPHVAAKLPSDSPSLYTHCMAILAVIDDKEHFPSPYPPIADIQTHSFERARTHVAKSSQDETRASSYLRGWSQRSWISGTSAPPTSPLMESGSDLRPGCLRHTHAAPVSSESSPYSPLRTAIPSGPIS